MKGVYFDHASTSYPKPQQVLQETVNYYNNLGVSPGRSSYQQAVKAEEIVFTARTLLAKLFNAQFPHQIVFTLNATHALNIAIQGCLSHGDHVLISDYEHNAVVRPLQALQATGVVTYDIVRSNNTINAFDIDLFKQQIKPNTKLFVINHGSNVVGTVLPLQAIGKIAREHNILFLVDGSQTAGLIDIDVEMYNIDFLAFTGHKSLMGPSGTGGLYVRNSELLGSLYQGGTGGNSSSRLQPETMPNKFEAGTINYSGVAGLAAALTYLFEHDRKKLFKEKIELTHYCLEQMRQIEEIQIYAASTQEQQLPVFSFTITDIAPQEIAHILDTEFNVMVRAGIHCAPLIHETLQTLPQGTVRFSFGFDNSIKQIDYAVAALKKIIHQYQCARSSHVPVTL